jgi:hypothetical protein
MKRITPLYLPLAFMLLLITIAFSSCSKSSSDNNSISITGTWKGTDAGIDKINTGNGNVTINETGTITMSLTQSGTEITGTFTHVDTSPAQQGIPAGDGGTVSGNIIGTINGSTITLGATVTKTSNGSTGGGNSLQGTINSAGTQISGTETSTGGNSNGTFTISKQ